MQKLYCPTCGNDRMVKNGTKLRANGRRQNYQCSNPSCLKDTTNPLTKTKEEDPQVEMRTSVPKTKRYIVTAAQNATPVHKPLWESIKRCAEYYDAELVVVPGRYKNPTSQWTEGNSNHEWWDSAVVPYLVTGRIELGSRLTILGNVKIQWAAMNPLTSMESLTKDKSAIIGHGRLALKTVATPQHKHPKILYTTGCVTVPNYTDTKQGEIAKFHHSYGALMVEVADDRFHVRQLCAMQNGSFCDLDKEFTSSEVLDAKRPLSLTMGDTHWIHIDKDVKRATFNGMLGELHPQYLIWHDVLDQYARNHHHRGNWLLDYKKHVMGMDDLKKEVEETLDGIVNSTPEDVVSVVVSSNHDQALGRWILESDLRKDPKNAHFYIELSRDMLEHLHDTGDVPDPFILYGRKRIQQRNVRFLEGDESFILAGVEHGLHGDRGPNGSRGTTRNLSKIGVKVTKGHSHTAEIVDGCYSAGTSTGTMEYAKGPSSWTNTHCLQYYNGKRTLITIVNGEWKL